MHDSWCVVMSVLNCLVSFTYSNWNEIRRDFSSQAAISVAILEFVGKRICFSRKAQAEHQILGLSLAMKAVCA